jgi:hypothetical protein
LPQIRVIGNTLFKWIGPCLVNLDRESRTESAPRQNLRDVPDLHLRGLASQQTAEVHEAGHICAGDELGTVADVIVDAVTAHGEGDVWLEDGEGAAEAAAFITAIERHDLQAFDHAEEFCGLGKVRDHLLAAFAETEAAQTVAALMQANPMRELRRQ